MARLIDKLRSHEAQVIADCMEHAHNKWPEFLESIRGAAQAGRREVRVYPRGNFPAERAVAAAVAAQAACEGLKVERLIQAEDAASVLGGRYTGPYWRVSW